jgi:hypothetical protein
MPRPLPGFPSGTEGGEGGIMAGDGKISVTRLIAVPAVITLAITLLRLAGELEHWGMPWFGNKPGGEAAVVGISWLPFIFGPYFAIKLARSGKGWRSGGRAWAFLGVAFAVLVASVALLGFAGSKGLRPLEIVGFAGMLAAAFVPRTGWQTLGRTLLAYAFAARVPVLIVMFFAMRGNGGAGWGTHYDITGADLAGLPFAEKFLYNAFLPQMTLWIAWTVIIGTLAGLIAVAVTRAHKTAGSDGAA